MRQHPSFLGRTRARDPRSFLEIRRLAARAQRSEEAREVLHDALLESLPAYAKAIEKAHALSDGGRSAVNVWFFPMRLSATTRKHGTTNLAFEEHRAFVERADLGSSGRNSRFDVNRALVVYETNPSRYLRYVDSKGDGSGEVIDLRDGHSVAYRFPALRYGGNARGDQWKAYRNQSVAALNIAFLRWMREHLSRHYTREYLLDWLRWNDPNGSYSDEDAWREDRPPLTLEEAADLVFEHVVDTKETPEEMRRHSRRS